MKNIIVPTDFSETAKDAFLFAQAIATEGDNICVTHVFMPHINPDNPVLTTNMTEVMQAKKVALQKFVEENILLPKGETALIYSLESEVAAGMTADALIEKSSDNTDLIVMGRTGENTLFEKIIGSVSIEVAQKANCPVLLIPKGRDFKGLQQIMFATDGEFNELSTLQNALQKIGITEADVHLVHVNPTGENYAISDSIQGDIFGQENTHFNFKQVEVGSKNVVTGLHKYAEDKGIDLMIIPTIHRSLLGKLFHKSVTKEMILALDVPLLVLHYDDE